MISLEEIAKLSIGSSTKIVMLVIDGLGGLPDTRTGKTELETAKTPNLDRLAAQGICGIVDPVSPGITPGSGPGHLALFGYDPLRFLIGRGVLEALGIDFQLRDGDVAARGNFCTVDAQGIITDRRAGRITTDKCTELSKLLSGIKLPKVQLFVLSVREHRFSLIMRGDRLSAELADTDPQKVGVTPYPARPTKPAAKHTADIVNAFVKQARQLLSSHHPANMILLRGFSKLPAIPAMQSVYKLRPAGVAAYPMYRGLAKLVGMDVFAADGGIEQEIRVLADHYDKYDFFFLHVKGTDTAGEDGDFRKKASVIEEIDSHLPQVLKLKPDVIVVTGDHSTPAVLKGHSWHPIPVLLSSSWCRRDAVKEFSESACLLGGLGRIPSTDIMPLAMANALKLTKFGA